MGESMGGKGGGKKWETYALDAAGMEGYRKMYMTGQLANEVIKERSSSDVVWRLRAI